MLTLLGAETASRAYDMLATTDFRSDIPLGYFSWDEYDLGRKVFDKRSIPPLGISTTWPP